MIELRTILTGLFLLLIGGAGGIAVTVILLPAIILVISTATLAPWLFLLIIALIAVGLIGYKIYG